MKLFDSLFRRRKIDPVSVAGEVLRVVNSHLAKLVEVRREVGETEAETSDGSKDIFNKGILDSFEELCVMPVAAARTCIIAYTGIEEPIRRQICRVVDEGFLDRALCPNYPTNINMAERDQKYFRVFTENKDNIFAGDGVLFASRMAFVFEQYCLGAGKDEILIGDIFESLGAKRLANDTWMKVFLEVSAILRNAGERSA